MKITLINPPFLFPAKNEIIVSQCLGLRSISAYLKTLGKHDVTFIDALMIGFDNQKPYRNGFIVGLEQADIVAAVPSDTELIGLSAPFSQLAPIVHELAARLKNAFPDVSLVMGGVYPSTQPELALSSGTDFIVVGEGEIALSDIAAGKEPQMIRGVYTRNAGPSDVYTPAEMVKDIDAIPFPDYSIPNIDSYFRLSQRMRKGRTASLVTSRGCPFACEFCSISPVYGRKYRAKSAGLVLSEIKYLVEEHGIQTLEIEDDNFTLQRQRTIDILSGLIDLIESGIPLEWNTPNGVRIDTLDEEIVRLIKQSNCTSITVALEHGDKDVLEIMNKRLDLESAFRVIQLLVQYEIPEIIIFVIVGYPGETAQRFENSLSYLQRVRRLGGNVKVCVNNAQPYPGTGLTKRCLEEGIIEDPQIGNFLIHKDLMSTAHFIPITTEDFDTREVLARRERVLNVFAPGWQVWVKKILPLGMLGSLRRLKRWVLG